MASIATRLRGAMERYGEYRRIVSEIENMSPREATDLGLSRSDAHRIARASVYGN